MWISSEISFIIQNCPLLSDGMAPEHHYVRIPVGFFFRAQVLTLTTKFMVSTWGLSGVDRAQVGPCWPHELCYLGSPANLIHLRCGTAVRTKNAPLEYDFSKDI